MNADHKPATPLPTPLHDHALKHGTSFTMSELAQLLERDRAELITALREHIEKLATYCEFADDDDTSREFLERHQALLRELGEGA